MPSDEEMACAACDTDPGRSPRTASPELDAAPFSGGRDKSRPAAGKDSAMDVFDSLFGLRTARQIANLSSEIAQRCCAGVWDRVQSRVLEMNTAEARGYIRAWAQQVVSPKITVQTLQARGIRAAHRAEITEQVVDGVVERLLSEVLSAQRTAKVQRRAA